MSNPFDPPRLPEPTMGPAWKRPRQRLPRLWARRLRFRMVVGPHVVIGELDLVIATRREWERLRAAVVEHPYNETAPFGPFVVGVRYS